jgi:hypothetical protein
MIDETRSEMMSCMQTERRIMKQDYDSWIYGNLCSLKIANDVFFKGVLAIP